jgi:hypothetical protein
MKTIHLLPVSVIVYVVTVFKCANIGIVTSEWLMKSGDSERVITLDNEIAQEFSINITFNDMSKQQENNQTFVLEKLWYQVDIMK